MGKNRVEQYLRELDATASAPIIPTEQPGNKRLTESTIYVQTNGDFRTTACNTLADLLESLDGRAMEYEHQDPPKPFNRNKFIAYHANPEIWDVQHIYRAGALELILGEQSVMTKAYDVSSDPSLLSEEYDPNAQSGIADEPSAHIVWNFGTRRFDGYLLKSSEGTLRFIVLSDKEEAKQALCWLTSEVASAFAQNGHRVNIVTQHKKYSEEL